MSDDNNFTGIGVHVCPICYAEHDECVLLHKRFGKLPSKSNIGYTLCDSCKARSEEYIALVAVSNNGSAVSPEEARPTGSFARVRRSAWHEVFSVPLPPVPYAYTDADTIARLESMAHPDDVTREGP